MTTIEDAGLFALARTGEAEEIIGALNDRIYSSAEAAPSPPPPTLTETEKKGLGAGAMAWWFLSTASMAASAYHGYKRNESIGWALGWGFLGSIFPIITPVVAIAQGFAKPTPEALRTRAWKEQYDLATSGA